MSEMNVESLESALNGAFAPESAPKVAKQSARPPEPDELEEPDAPVETEDPADLLAGEPEVESGPKTEPETEPEFEIEIEPGKPEVLPLAKLKELAARGAKAGRGFEENARVRDALQVRAAQLQAQQQFNQAASQDIAQIQALEAQLQPYEKMDWSAEYDRDPFNAMKIKEQRDQLREARAAAIQTFNAKQQQFQQWYSETTQKALAAENEALLAKVPTWRNQEKATQEKGEIANYMMSHYGYSRAEAEMIADHRHMVVLRDAVAYRKLLANKDARVKQAREAPATVKPGAAAPQTNGRAEFAKTRNLIKAHGAKGNHRAQEQLAEKLLGAAFK